MFVKDAVFGNIEITPVEAKLIDTPEMQRLRYIKQTGLAYLVYPGATHSRFEHSLGTMNISKEIANAVNLGKEEVESLAIAGLLHDIGHGPFSHLSDDILSKYLNTNHEKIGRDIITKSKIKEIIEGEGFSLNDILKKLSGKSNGEIVTASLGSDRLDYLLRDAHYTGVTYGVIDYQQIKSKITLCKDHIAIYEQGIAPAESLLIARYFMFTTVYHHHAVTIASSMLQKAVELAIENKEIEPREFAKMNDFELMERLLHSGTSKDLARRLIERRLFKRVLYGDAIEVPSKEEIEKAILDNTTLKEGEFVVSVAKLKFINEETPVLNRNRKVLGSVESLSPIIKTLKEREITKILIASERKNKKKILRAIKGLNIKTT
ncbi:MAG: HD domain-containing protein [Candidatus Micrarchaeia archaeon]|jgi:HD superfamily phosphohydrolase